MTPGNREPDEPARRTPSPTGPFYTRAADGTLTPADADEWFGPAKVTARASDGTPTGWRRDLTRQPRRPREPREPRELRAPRQPRAPRAPRQPREQRPGARRATTARDDGDPDEPPPARVAPAPKPKAILTYGHLTADERGAVVA